MLANNSTLLPLKPPSVESVVITYFWVDNFDMNIEKSYGAGSINITHMVAFQEPNESSVISEYRLSVQRLKKRSLTVLQSNTSKITINSTKEPEVINLFINNTEFNVDLLWLYFRLSNYFDQVVPSFSGWLLEYRKSSFTFVTKTVATYLPPITTKVTETITIEKYLNNLRMLAKEAGMLYTNTTLDVGAAMSSYKFIWNYPDNYRDVVIHFVKENFQVIGPFITESGFEDIVYQSNVCSTGSLLDVLSGSHYNRCWTVHNATSERLFLMAKFLKNSDFVLSAVTTSDPQFSSNAPRFIRSMQLSDNK